MGNLFYDLPDDILDMIYKHLHKSYLIKCLTTPHRIGRNTAIWGQRRRYSSRGVMIERWRSELVSGGGITGKLDKRTGYVSEIMKELYGFTLFNRHRTRDWFYGRQEDPFLFSLQLLPHYTKKRELYDTLYTLQGKVKQYEEVVDDETTTKTNMYWTFKGKKCVNYEPKNETKKQIIKRIMKLGDDYKPLIPYSKMKSKM